MTGVSRFYRRGPYRTVVAIILCILVSACTASGDLKNASKGIGSDLYSSDLAAATRNLEIYLGYLCKQGNIPTLDGAESYPECDYGVMDVQAWTILVQTGFNDIDRRCDGYLEWLEAERHRVAFVNSQVNSAGRLTNQILTAVVPSAGLAIGIVSEAFGFTKAAFTDYQTRIMLGYESSTIKTLVSERRLAYRVQFADVAFRYKPDAVNVLRSYLRICMPYTITMDANAYARALATGNDLPNYVRPELERETIVGGNALAGPITATTTIFAPERPGTDNPVTIERIDRAVQQALCVGADGEVGPKTVEAIKIYKYAEDIKPVDGELSDNEENDIIVRFGEQSEMASGRFGPCSTGIRNYLERTKLLDNNAQNPEGLTQLRVFLRMLNEEHGADIDIGDTDDLATLRPKIASIRAKMGGSFHYAGAKSYLNEQWTPELLEEIRRLTETQPN